MIMTTEYFNANVNVAMEFETEEGYRFWETYKGYEEADEGYQYHKKLGYYFSDEDFCTYQDDENIRYFLNLVEYNCHNNPIYKNKGLSAVLEIALDNWNF